MLLLYSYLLLNGNGYKKNQQAQINVAVMIIEYEFQSQ